AQALVLDLGGGQLLPLDALTGGAEGEPAAVPSWQLGGLPRHALDLPSRHEAGFEPWPPGGPPLLRWDAGPLQSPLQPPLQLQPAPLPGPALLWSRRAASARLSPANLGHPRPGPVLLMGADPGRPPQLCLALLQGKAGVWRHDARPIAMDGGGLCLDLQGRLLGWLRPMNEEDGHVLALLWS
ncbi:MAG TPA: hypothetical protein VK195_04525, partial [Burkholderiaceae bacterium]|nr:hypothetical protein [Burkholderiaceae bacterium]